MEDLSYAVWLVADVEFASGGTLAGLVAESELGLQVPAQGVAASAPCCNQAAPG